MLDDKKLFEKTNINLIYESICLFLEQFEDAWFKVDEIKIPEIYRTAKNVVISGMGGSALGGRIVDSLIPDRVRVPIEVFTEFRLPYYVSRDSLVLLSSYSGNTYETLSCARQAVMKNAMVFAITTGGKLEEISIENKFPFYKINPLKNPSKQPRMGLGYSIASIISLLTKLGYIHFSDKEILDSIKEADAYLNNFTYDKNEHVNLAKKIAIQLKNYIPILIASEHLVGSAHAVKNQLNENSKTFSVLFDLPELNHHLMEGLKNPFAANQKIKFIFLKSDLYSKDSLKRYDITRKVVEKNNVETLVYQLNGKNKFVQILETVIFGLFVSFYLSMLYNEDPSEIPWVDYFKKELEN